MKAISGFEAVTCGRCGGTGKYSYCTMYGNTCFGCGGSGIKLSKRGAAAKAYLEESLLKTLDEIKPGDLVRVTDALHGKIYWTEFVSMEPDKLNKGMIRLVYKRGGLTTFEDKALPVVKDRADYDAKKAAALEYEGKLTKAGKLMKKHTKKGA